MTTHTPRDPGGGGTVAIVLWGNVLEDFTDSLGLSLEAFSTEFTGSWVFGYAEALRSSGLTPVIFCVSRAVTSPVCFRHRPTGTTVCALPPARPYRVLSRFMRNPYGRTRREMFGEPHGWRRLLQPLLAVLQSIALYCSTPPLVLAHQLRRFGCRAIICQEYEYPRFDVCVLVGRVLRIPVFATFQGGNYHHSRIERLVRPVAFRAAAGAFIASRAELERVHRRYRVPEARLFQVFNPIDVEAWQVADRGGARVELGIPTDALVVAWHGRISIHHKGLDTLLDAWRTVSRARPRQMLRLLVVGSGPHDQTFQQLIEQLDVSNVVWMREFIHDRGRLRRYLSAADVYAFASRHEGFALAPLEAMACGLPVVASDAPGISELLQDGLESGGIIVPTENGEDLGRGIGRLLDDAALRRRVSESARARAVAFSMARVGSQLRAAIVDSFRTEVRDQAPASAPSRGGGG